MVLGHSDYHYQHEPIMYGWLPGGGRSGRGDHADSRWYGGNTRVSIFEIPRPKRSTEHPTMKPVALVEAHLQNSTRRGEVVLDPFCGSGASLAACERLGRQGRGAEISPNFVAVAIDQWVKMTGGAPERLEAV